MDNISWVTHMKQNTQLRKSENTKILFSFFIFFHNLIYFLSCCFDLFLKRQLTSPKILPSNHNTRGPHRYGNGCLVTDKAPTPPSSRIVVSWLVGLCLGCCSDWLPVLVALLSPRATSHALTCMSCCCSDHRLCLVHCDFILYWPVHILINNCQ